MPRAFSLKVDPDANYPTVVPQKLGHFGNCRGVECRLDFNADALNENVRGRVWAASRRSILG